MPILEISVSIAAIKHDNKSNRQHDKRSEYDNRKYGEGIHSKLGASK